MAYYYYMTQEELWLLKEKYHGNKSEGFLEDAKRLQAGEPLGYVIGWVPFLNCKIWLDTHPLIPRPETEFWTKHFIEHVSENTAPGTKILDLCAGSGCIGVAIARAVTTALVDFVEVDVRHHALIHRNLLENGLDERACRIFGGNLFSEFNTVTEEDVTYDYIVSNPPYIDPALNRVEQSVAVHEPHVALYGGHGGVELIQHIIEQSTQHLSPSGELWIEHEPEQQKEIARIATEFGFNIVSHKDQYGTVRYSTLTHA